MTPTGPPALLRTLPATLGRAPADELVLVGVTRAAPTAATVVSVGLPAAPCAEADAEAAAAAIGVGVELACRDGATAVAVVVYADGALPADSTPARFGATAVVCAEAAGLRVLDTLAVTGGRWRSYECTDPSCCPPEGTPITTEGTTP